jgi:hypothetical protein
MRKWKEAKRMEMKPISMAQMTEAKIAERIAAAGIRLRFDKVALRLLDGVKEAIGQTLPTDQRIVFTVTAPIKLPAKTSAALQERLRQLRSQELNTTIHGNEIRARIVKNTSRHMPRVIGFVHNPDIDADLLLTIAETSLRER